LSKLGSHQSIVQSMKFPVIPKGITEITLVFAGVDTNDNLVEDLQQALLFHPKKDSRSTQGYVIPYPILDTAKLSITPLPTMVNSMQAYSLGEHMGYEVARRIPARIRKIHVVGISTGSHAADAFVRIIKTRNNQRERTSSSSSSLSSTSRRPIYIQQTFIQPHCTRGVRNERYGEQEFGRWADYAQQIFVRGKVYYENPLNTKDICTKCAILDVTSCRPRGISDRDWPIVFLIHRLGLGFVSDSKKCKRGNVTSIKLRNRGEK
jgi:hypothetical protein